MDDLPDEYIITTQEAHDAGVLTIEEAMALYEQVETILAGAQNADNLDLAGLFAWSIADTTANIQDVGLEHFIITGVEEWDFINTHFTVEFAKKLLDAPNFKGVIKLEDDFSNLWSNRDVVEKAVSVKVVPPEGSNLGVALLR